MCAITLAAYISLFERKLIARIQLRLGPDHCGPCGIFQPIADALKLFFKRDALKGHSKQSIFAVCLLFFTSLLQLILIPISHDVFKSTYGLLFVILLHSVIVFSEILIGTSSKSKYGVIGGVRSYIQIVGSHMPFVLSLILMMLLTKTLNLSELVSLQKHTIFAIPLFPIFVVFFITSLMITNHIPFDFPEAESELVAGAYVEYGGILFGMIYLSDYLNLIFISALTATLFLGGAGSAIFSGYVAIVLKTILLASLVILIRAILPRYRQDQMIKISWMILSPILFIFIFILI